jgi:hypothetical protein
VSASNSLQLSRRNFRCNGSLGVALLNIGDLVRRVRQCTGVDPSLKSTPFDAFFALISSNILTLLAQYALPLMCYLYQKKTAGGRDFAPLKLPSSASYMQKYTFHRQHKPISNQFPPALFFATDVQRSLLDGLLHYFLPSILRNFAYLRGHVEKTVFLRLSEIWDDTLQAVSYHPSRSILLARSCMNDT